MSGKSTLLRSLGLAAVLGQTVNTVAGDYEAPVLRVQSCIGRAIASWRGRATTWTRLRRSSDSFERASLTGRICFSSTRLFRGTNVIERIAAGEATLRELATTIHIVVAATHDVEIVALLDGIYAPFHLVDRMEPDGLVFEYRLAEGPSTTRNAIALLELNGAPASLVRRARERAEHLGRAQRPSVPTIAPRGSSRNSTARTLD